MLVLVSVAKDCCSENFFFPLERASGKELVRDKVEPCGTETSEDNTYYSVSEKVFGI